MTDNDTQNALREAREAVRVANQALRLAERAAGIDHAADPRHEDVVDELTVKQIKVMHIRINRRGHHAHSQTPRSHGHILAGARTPLRYDGRRPAGGTTGCLQRGR